jgi:hypothetical protein
MIVDGDDIKYPHNYLQAEILINNHDRNTTQLFNWALETHPGYEFYSCTNDDFVYLTPGWDDALMLKGHISYGNDLLAGGDMPTTSVIDGDIVRTLGWLQMPKLQFTQGDAVWKAIGHRLNILKYFPDVIIEHRHWSVTGQIDATSQRMNNSKVVNEDAKAFREWLHNEMENDAQKISRCMELHDMRE